MAASGIHGFSGIHGSRTGVCLSASGTHTFTPPAKSWRSRLFPLTSTSSTAGFLLLPPLSTPIRSVFPIPLFAPCPRLPSSVLRRAPSVLPASSELPNCPDPGCRPPLLWLSTAPASAPPRCAVPVPTMMRHMRSSLLGMLLFSSGPLGRCGSDRGRRDRESQTTPDPPSIYDYPARLYGTRDHGIDWLNDRFEKEFDGVQDVFELQVS